MMKTYVLILMMGVLLTAIHLTSMPDKQGKPTAQ